MRPESANVERSVCLVTALTVADFIDPDLIVGAHANTGAQLGVLTLAALLREQGFAPTVVNLDDCFFDFVRRDTSRRSVRDGRAGAVETSDDAGEAPQGFFAFLVEHLRSLPLDTVGLSSICSSYPLTLRLAAEIKRINPHATVVLGGPQASVVDVPTIRAFPCVDVIVRGEAEETFPALLRLLDRQDDAWQGMPGITFRRGDSVMRNPNAPIIEDLDRLPLPAFDFDLQIRDRGGVHLEIGRGCPFACTFCSTNDFFRRNFRLKSPTRMIGDIASLKKEYGVNYFSLVHDMYTIDRKKVVAFCETILASGERFTWGCSARTDCIDDELLGLMARAGCTGIFFGIETGSERLQHVINKRLDLAEARERIACADRNGIHTTVAFIVGFPEETRDDLRDTVHFFIDSLRFDRVEPQCSLLAPLAATPIYELHKHHLVFDDMFSDMSHQSWRQDAVEADMIKAHPAVFPNFYAVPTVWLERKYLKEVVDFTTYLATWFRWLPVALLQDSGDLLAVFDRWQRWRRDKEPSAADEDTGWTPYYSHRRFHGEFLDFVRTCYVREMATAPAAITAVARAESVTARDRRPPIVEPVDDPDASSVPYPLDASVVVDLDIDYKELIDSLRHGRGLNHVSVRPTTIAFSATRDQFDTWQLPALSATLLGLCDGRRTVGEITRLFHSVEPPVEGVPLGTVCLFGLMQLREDGFIGFSAAPPIWGESPAARDGVLVDPPRQLPPRHATNTQQPWPASGPTRSIEG